MGVGRGRKEASVGTPGAGDFGPISIYIMATCLSFPSPHPPEGAGFAPLHTCPKKKKNLPVISKGSQSSSSGWLGAQTTQREDPSGGGSPQANPGGHADQVLGGRKGMGVGCGMGVEEEPVKNVYIYILLQINFAIKNLRGKKRPTILHNPAPVPIFHEAFPCQGGLPGLGGR